MTFLGFIKELRSWGKQSPWNLGGQTHPEKESRWDLLSQSKSPGIPWPWRNFKPEDKCVRAVEWSSWGCHYTHYRSVSGSSSKDHLHSHREDFQTQLHLSSPPLSCPLLPLALARRERKNHCEIPQTPLPYNSKDNPQRCQKARGKYNPR